MTLSSLFAPLRRASRRTTVGLVATTLVAAGLTAVVVAEPATAAMARVNAVNAATAYARAHGVRAGIAVLDTKTGQLIGNKYRRSEFASESVIKVMIAARLIKQGRMHGSTSARAKRMIACSNDNIANSFYGSVGGDGLLNWTKKKFKVSTLGHGPIRGGWWGSNRITAEGMVRLYAKLKADKHVWPWLYRAMRAHTKRGCDGFYQAFGLPQAASKVAVKQGWGGDYSYRKPNASMNSTGYVGGGRYAVAILARGKASTYGTRLGNAITGMAKRLLPGRQYPSGAPRVTYLSARSGYTTGRNALTLRGMDLSGVRLVSFGGINAPFRNQSTASLYVVAPPHAAGTVPVYVWTKYGRSVAQSYHYVTKPAPTTAPTPVPTTPAPTTTSPAPATQPQSGSDAP